MDKKAGELRVKLKEAAGNLTNNQNLKDLGKADKAAGKAKQAVERFIDKVRDSMKRP